MVWFVAATLCPEKAACHDVMLVCKVLFKVLFGPSRLYSNVTAVGQFVAWQDWDTISFQAPALNYTRVPCLLLDIGM